MPVSTVIVQRDGGVPVKRATVVLGFVDETTEGDRTDGRGHATVEHTATGRAVIFVNGIQTGHMTTPGECLVMIY